jgi:type I restriction enzyme S subunit
MFEDFRTSARKVMTGTGGQLRVPIKFLDEFPITLPPIELQNEFETFVKQSDKSKFEIKKSIENINVLMKSLMQENYNN